MKTNDPEYVVFDSSIQLADWNNKSYEVSCVPMEASASKDVSVDGDVAKVLFEELSRALKSKEDKVSAGKTTCTATRVSDEEADYDCELATKATLVTGKLTKLKGTKAMLLIAALNDALEAKSIVVEEPKLSFDSVSCEATGGNYNCKLKLSK
jgi:hypothetical protein